MPPDMVRGVLFCVLSFCILATTVTGSTVGTRGRSTVAFYGVIYGINFLKTFYSRSGQRPGAVEARGVLRPVVFAAGVGPVRGLGIDPRGLSRRAPMVVESHDRPGSRNDRRLDPRGIPNLAPVRDLAAWSVCDSETLVSSIATENCYDSADSDFESGSAYRPASENGGDTPGVVLFRVSEARPTQGESEVVFIGGAVAATHSDGGGVVRRVDLVVVYSASVLYRSPIGVVTGGELVALSTGDSRRGRFTLVGPTRDGGRENWQSDYSSDTRPGVYGNSGDLSGSIWSPGPVPLVVLFVVVALLGAVIIRGGSPRRVNSLAPTVSRASVATSRRGFRVGDFGAIARPCDDRDDNRALFRYHSGIDSQATEHLNRVTLVIIVVVLEVHSPDGFSGLHETGASGDFSFNGSL
jgi:hypothetical protein